MPALHRVLEEDFGTVVRDARGKLLLRARRVHAARRADRVAADSRLTFQNDDVRALFRRRGFHLYEDANGKFSARLLRVEQDGRFVLEDENGKEREYLFKEVQYIL